MTCKTCGTEMIPKSRGRLVGVGVAMLASTALVTFVPYFWVPALVLGLTGLYLLVWATYGQGQWCRTCKGFPMAR
ncbi:MAG: hypothetical protein U0746_22105 [Gemmataceae bacterium]